MQLSHMVLPPHATLRVRKSMSTNAHLSPTPLPDPQSGTQQAAPDTGAQPSGFDRAVGGFVYRHRDATTRPLGHVTYQIIRNLAAAVPYGLATAGVWTGFEKLAQRTANSTSELGKGVNGLARSPVRDIAMIAAGFSLYRGTLRFVRYTKERLFNPENSEQESISEIQHFGKHAAETVREIAPAEINSTPYGAIALGLGRRYIDGIDLMKNRATVDKIIPGSLANPAAGHQRMLQFTRDGKFSPHLTGTAAGAAAGRTPFKEFLGKIGGKASRPWTEAGVFILSFLSFFELSDRLYKDVQVRRGVWRNDPNSLVRVQPKQGDEVEAAEKELGLDRDPDYLASKKHTYTQTFGASDPNLLRLAFTRVIPTVLGIGAYTFTKRASYAAMGHFSAKDTFLKRATVEGLATSTFFVMTTAADTFEGIWKKHFESKNTSQPLTPHQQAKYAELQAHLEERSAQRA